MKTYGCSEESLFRCLARGDVSHRFIADPNAEVSFVLCHESIRVSQIGRDSLGGHYVERQVQMGGRRKRTGWIAVKHKTDTITWDAKQRQCFFFF